MTDEHEQTVLDLAAPDTGGAPKRVRAKRRRRGGIEVLKSGAVRVRIRGVKLPDGRVVTVDKTITEGPSIPWRVEEAKRVVRPALERRALDLECGRAAYDASVTLADAVQRLRASHSIKWRRADEAMWKRLRSEWQVSLASITEDRVRALFQKWEKEGLSSGYRRALFALVRRVLNIAATKGMLARVPVWSRGLLPPKHESKRGMSAKLSPSQKAALFEAARMIDAEGGAGDLADRLAFQLDTMLRPIECAWARAEDLREESDGWHFYPTRAKGSGLKPGEGVDRLFVGAALAARIMARFDALPARAQALGWLFPRPMPRGLYGPRWRDERGSRQAKWWVTEHEVRQLRERSGLTSWIAYMLRHTRAHELAAAGASVWQLQQFGAWAVAEQASTYVGRVLDRHPSMLAPSAPVPGAAALRVVDGSPTRTTATDSGAAGNAPASVDLSGAGENPTDSNVGPDGRGPTVDRDAIAWAGLGERGRLDALAVVRDAMAVAVGWTDPAVAAGALLRREGVESARELLGLLALVSSVGGAGEDGPRLAGLVSALRSLLAVRGVKKGSGTGQKSSNLVVMGAATGYRTGVINNPRAGSEKAPGNGPKK